MYPRNRPWARLLRSFLSRFWQDVHIANFSKGAQVSNVRSLSCPCLKGGLITEGSGRAMINEIDHGFDCIWPETFRHSCPEQLAHGSLGNVLYTPFGQPILLVFIWSALLVNHTICFQPILKCFTAKFFSPIQLQILKFQVSLMFGPKFPLLEARECVALLWQKLDPVVVCMFIDQ